MRREPAPRLRKNKSSVPSLTQHWDPDRYARNARFVADLGSPLIDLLAPQPGERILDLGCGDGALTEAIAAHGGKIVGVDASPEQVAAAQKRGLDARIMDGRRLTFTQEFDAVISNAAMHWMGPSGPVLAGVARALKPGGRLVAEMGGHGNVAAIVKALSVALAQHHVNAATLNPWFFPDEATMESLLHQAGFHIDQLTLFKRPTPLPGDLAAWLDTFAESFLGGLKTSDAERVKTDVASQVKSQLCDSQGRWVIDYVRLRFVAHLP